MKISDILRQLADRISSIEGGEEQPAAPQNLEPTAPAELTSPADNKDVAQGDDKFIPPLQQKLELLKKAVDVSNAFDNATSQPDEVDDVKRMAGVKAIAVHTGSEDNDITG
jgi:hypothetical protein